MRNVAERLIIGGRTSVSFRRRFIFFRTLIVVCLIWQSICPARARIFIKANSGGLTNESGIFHSSSWVDYDNDGDLDLFLVNVFHVPESTNNNALYRNDGNGNSWIDIRLVGVASNRQGLGAKVRAQAVINGASRWQTRMISGGDGVSNQSLTAHFGFGNATIIDTIRIEWPLGIVQELKKVPVRQFLTVTEPPKLGSATRLDNGTFQLTLTGGPSRRYVVQASTNLASWTDLVTVSNLTSRTFVFNDPNASNHTQRFYRALQQ